MATNHSVGRFCIIAEGQLLVCGQDSETPQELSSAERGTAELETDTLELASVEPVNAASVDEPAVFKGTVDELGIIHTDLNSRELLALDGLHALPFRIYKFSGSLGSAQ